MAEFHFRGVYAAGNTGYFGNAAPPPYGLNPPICSEASPPYPTKLQSNGMPTAIGCQSDYSSYPQGPLPMPHQQGPPYPTTSQLPCAPPQHDVYLSPPSMACTFQNTVTKSPPPTLPPFVNQQSLTPPYGVTQKPPSAPYMANQQSLTSSYVVTQKPPSAPYMANQQSLTPPYGVAQKPPLAPYMAYQQACTSSMLLMPPSNSVAMSNHSYLNITNIKQPSKSLSKEIATGVLAKVVQHASKGKQATVVTGGSSVIIYK